MVRWAVMGLMLLCGGGCAVHVHKHVCVVALPASAVRVDMNSTTDASGNTADADAAVELPLLGG